MQEVGNVEAIVKAIDDKDDSFFLAQPTNPVGRVYGR